MVSVEEALARIERDARVTERHHLTVAWGDDPEHGYMARLSATCGTSAVVIPSTGPLSPDDLVWHVEHYHHTLLEELCTLHLDTAWPACLFCPSPHPMKVAAEEGDLWWTCPGDFNAAGAVGGVSGPRRAVEPSNATTIARAA